MTQRRIATSLGVVCPQWWGAKGDSSTDDTEAIKRAVTSIADATQDGSRLAGITLQFPRAVGYRTSSPIHVPPGISVEMDAPILFSGDDSSTAFIIGKENVANPLLRHRLRVRKDPLSDWADESSMGIQIHNANSCQIDVVQVEGFTIGVQCVGSGQGFCYNEIHLGWLINNKIGLDLSSMNSGCANENLFLNGRFSTWTGVQPGESRYGVRITSGDGTYTHNNNNLFIKPCFELNAPAAEPDGEAVPILVEHGVLNRFESCRAEGNSAIFARVLNDSQGNEFHTGYGYDPGIDDQSRSRSSWVTSRLLRLITHARSALFLSGPLHKRAGYYDKNRVHVPGVHLMTSTSDKVERAVDSIIIADDYLQLPPGRGVGIFIDTSRLKRFVVRPDVDEGYGGRIRVRCYDRDGKILQDLGNGTPYVTGMSFHTLYFDSASFGGTYITGSDGDVDLFVAVGDEVKIIDVFLVGGSKADLRIRSFGVYSVDKGMATAWTGFEGSVEGVNLVAGMPAKGNWQTGRIVYNAKPRPGEPVGWVCIQGGTPGVWKPYGTIGE